LARESCCNPHERNVRACAELVREAARQHIALAAELADDAKTAFR
jgi:hypothetical protein